MTPGGRRRAGSVSSDDGAMLLHQIDHGVKSMIHGDHVMSRSDADNYRPLATHVEDTTAPTQRQPAQRLRSNNSRRARRRPTADDSLDDDVSISRDALANTTIAERRVITNASRLFRVLTFYGLVRKRKYCLDMPNN